MRLLNTSTLQLEGFSSTESTPPYAILSHTWGKDSEEVSFDDMKSNLRSPDIEMRYGFEKVKMTCQIAREVYGLDFAWVDTCCIDQTSSAELSESINSMFKWYHRAVICLAFLADWNPNDRTFEHCKWFTRGWTLQELIASKEVIFYDSAWLPRGNKLTLCSELSKTTMIQEDVLVGRTPLSEVPVAVRMSWASRRVTTREEDIAYCLLGMFDINMPMLYGEGHKAFLRLQEEIIKEHADLSIFAWRALPESSLEYMGMFAPSPKEFQNSHVLYPVQNEAIPGEALEFAVTNRGVRFSLPCWKSDKEVYAMLPLLHTDHEQSSRSRDYGVYLRMVGSRSYVRALPHHFAVQTPRDRNMPLHQHSPVTVFKNISATNSENVSQRAIRVCGLSDLISHLDFPHAVLPSDVYWNPRSTTLYATGDGSPSYHFEFSQERLIGSSSFFVQIQFKNPRGTPFSSGYWECDIIHQQGSEELKVGHVLSSDNLGSSRVEKSIILPSFRHKRRRKRVVLWLQRDHYNATGQPEHSVGLQVHDEEKK